MTARIVFGALVAGAALAGGCAPGGAARELRAEEPTAEGAMGGSCVTPGEPSEPWTFDLEGTKRGELSAAMKRGLVLVSYDCNRLELVKGCRAPGDYEYAAYPAEFEVLDLRDGDSVRASLSGGQAIAAALKAEFERGTALLISHGEAGMSSTTVWELPRDRLQGSAKACDRATHFVEAIHFGAFAMKTSTSAQIGSALELFDQGVSANSESSSLRNKVSGSPDACKKGNPDGAPRECDYVVRLRLVPISEEASEGGSGSEVAPPPPPPPAIPRPPACPPGFVRSGGACMSLKTAASYTCKVGDASDCNSQCAKGSAESCAILGFMHEKGTGVRASDMGARIHYEKACNKGNSDGCTGLAYLISKGEGGMDKDEARARGMFDKECKRGNARACSGLGQIERFAGKLGLASMWFRRACSLGYTRGCFYEGLVLQQDGKGSALERARKSFVRACRGGELRGCLAASPMVAAGTGGDQDPKEASIMRSMAMVGLDLRCRKGDAESCKILGDVWSGKYDPKMRDPARAKEFYGKACKAGLSEACKEAGPPGPPPGPPGPPGPRPPGPPRPR